MWDSENIKTIMYLCKRFVNKQQLPFGQVCYPHGGHWSTIWDYAKRSFALHKVQNLYIKPPKNVRNLSIRCISQNR